MDKTLSTEQNQNATHWLSRRILAWASFDMLSSVYFGTVPSVIFPLYFQSQVAAGPGARTAWGLLAAVGLLASGLAALSAAELSRRLRRFPLMALCMALISVGLATLAWAGGDSLWLAASTYVLMQSCYFAATASYESFLPQIAPAGVMHRVSGFGWAIGYGGGIVALGVLFALVPEEAQGLQQYQRSFAVLAALTALLALPVFVGLWCCGFHRSGETTARRHSGVLLALRHWRAQRPVFAILAAQGLIHLVIAVVITFTATILANSFGQTLFDLLRLALVMQGLAVPGTWALALLADRWSREGTAVLVLFCWALVLVLLAVGEGPGVPTAIVVLLSLCLGSSQAAIRALLAEAIEPSQSEDFFALAAVAGRLGAALGPLFFVAAAATVGEAPALVGVLAALAASAVLLHGRLRRGPLSVRGVRS